MHSDPEEGTTREEVKELALNREDLEALKEMPMASLFSFSLGLVSLGFGLVSLGFGRLGLEGLQLVVQLPGEPLLLEYLSVDIKITLPRLRYQRKAVTP